MASTHSKLEGSAPTRSANVTSSTSACRNASPPDRTTCWCLSGSGPSRRLRSRWHSLVRPVAAGAWVFVGGMLLAAATLLVAPRPRRMVQLPRGVLELHSEMALESGAQLIGAPSGSVLRAARD